MIWATVSFWSCFCWLYRASPSMSALWWRRVRGLWKHPDGRDWLRGKLGLVLRGGAVLSKSLIQLSVNGWGCNGCLRSPYKQLRKEEKLKAREKRKDTHLNAEFQRIARREKKAFLRDQCKEIEKNNRMGKTRDLFKKTRDTKGTFHAKMGTIKDRNGMDLTEADDIKKRWQEYTELYKKDLHDPDDHDGVITHLESYILGCEVK